MESKANKVLCVNNKHYNGYYYITIGWTYYILSEKEGNVLVINDALVKTWYPKNYFKSFEEIREEKINDILK